MKKNILSASCVIALGLSSFNVHSALMSNAHLSIDSGSYFDFLGVNPITGADGINLGAVQHYDFSFAGGIDYFVFLGAPGMHYTTSPTSVLSTSGNTAALDFSGWSWAFNGASSSFNLGSGAWAGNAEGVADVVCAVDCGHGDTYTLIYSATVPADEPNGYAGFVYSLNLTGTISSVPVPAAIWLFVSGLMSIFGLARFRRMN
ncbi:MAG: hypothetical protein OEZ38_06630 [Gammaproteobacteria bacterium]|nr:hypothetical protein [Gammaproteobacteria bacterium]